jgi:hypothetical protein
VLRLASNQFEGPLPAEWANFGRLEELALGGNQLIDFLRDGWISDRLPSCIVTF